MANQTAAASAEALMRSRYSAFVTGNSDWLRDSWHPARRPPDTSVDTSVQWIGLKIVRTEAGTPNDATGIVEVVARCKRNGRAHRMREVSLFERIEGRWLYVEGEVS